jgi:hypothetical protein
MWEGATQGRVTSQAVTNATGRTGNRDSRQTDDAVAYFYWRDLYQPVIRELAEASVTWHLDRIRYTGLPLDERTSCRSIGHWNRVDQLEYFSVIEGNVSMHIQLAGTERLAFQLSMPGTILAIPPGCWHHTTTTEPATVDNIYCYLKTGFEDDKYSRQGHPTSFLSALDRHTWEGCALTDLFSGDAEWVWKQLDEECARLVDYMADGI